MRRFGKEGGICMTIQYLQYNLTLRSPAILSTSCIPGGVIRGALAGSLLRAGVSAEDENGLFYDLILSGNVRFLHVYPEINGKRALPVPASWRCEKNKPETAYDLADYEGDPAEAEDEDDFSDMWPNDVTGVDAGFVTDILSNSKRITHAPEICARLHQQRDREKGRSWTEKKNRDEIAHGTIFSYEYLEAGQKFKGVIQILPEGKRHIEKIKEYLSQSPLLIGRSRRAGYGGNAEINFDADSSREYENFSGSIKYIEAGESFRLMTTSACIAKDPDTGQTDPAALEREIIEKFQDQNPAAQIKLIRRRWEFEKTGGFNQKWRLEIPQALAVSPGSVFVFKALSRIPVELIEKILHEGFGERRTEGFGRVVFLPHRTCDPSENKGFPIQKTKNDVSSTESDPVAGKASDDDLRDLNFIEKRIVLSAARTELNASAAVIVGECKKIPNNNLIGRLRSLFRNVRDMESAETALKTLGDWCGDNEREALKKTAREQLNRCELQGKSLCELRRKSLLDWLKILAQCTCGEEGWEIVADAAGRPSTLTGLMERFYVTNKKAAATILHENSLLLAVDLTDAVLAAMALKNRRGES